MRDGKERAESSDAIIHCQTSNLCLDEYLKWHTLFMLHF